jgi:citrate lyase subunit beta/citryl-CoA lyase
VSELRLRRCVLAVPGSSAKMAAKACALDVDQVMLDLEDALAPSAKPAARATVIDSLKQFDWTGKIVSVRINDVTTPWFERDVIEVVEAAGGRIDTIVLPKVENAADVRMLALLLSRVERLQGFERRIGIEPQIETALGLTHAESISQAHERVESLTFGPADFAASIGSPVLTIGGQASSYPGHVWHYALSRIVVAAKAAGRMAIDGPYGVLDNAEGLAQSAAMARTLGCDGKWAIHPAQIEIVTSAFTPSDEELERARRIARRYADLADREGGGAVSYENELLDAATARLAGSLLKRGPKTGEV